MSSALKIEEYDGASRLMGTYVESGGKRRGEGGGERRVDFIIPENPKAWYQTWILDPFLPAGYPQSVTEDYLWYQIYDSLQAFASSIAGMLSSRAVLEGVGVGDSTVTPTHALLMTTVQEIFSRLTTILFAHRFGTSLEPECKMYRLAADVFNDAAMILDCLSPAFPKGLRLGLLVGSSSLRALCGVAAGSSKASLSNHFAQWGNLGELNAKDSSQETIISLLGTLCGTVTVSYVTTRLWTWVTLILLLIVHISTNRMAVRSVSMRTLNRQRTNLLYSSWVKSHDRIPLTPSALSLDERIFEIPGNVLRLHGRKLGWAKIGARMDELVACIAACGRNSKGRAQTTTTGAIKMPEDIGVDDVLRLYADDPYLLWWSVSQQQAIIVLKTGCKTKDQIRAWIQALMMARVAAEAGWRAKGEAVGPEKVMEEMRNTLQQLRKSWLDLAGRFRAAGWDLETSALETGPAYRAAVVDAS